MFLCLQSKCQDKKTVCLKYEYEKATLIQSVLSELKETSEVSHWIIFEEIPLIAYKLVQCRWASLWDILIQVLINKVTAD